MDACYNDWGEERINTQDAPNPEEGPAAEPIMGGSSVGETLTPRDPALEAAVSHLEKAKNTFMDLLNKELDLKDLRSSSWFPLPPPSYGEKHI